MKKLIFTLQLLIATTLVFAGNDKGDENKKESVTTKTEAQYMALSGKVTDQMTGEALTGVKVSIDGLDAKVYTDFDGNFRIESLAPGEYNITTSYVSYNKKQIQKYNTTKEGSHLEIRLQSTH